MRSRLGTTCGLRIASSEDRLGRPGVVGVWGTLHDHKLRLGIDPSLRQCTDSCSGSQRSHNRANACTAREGFFSAISEKTRSEHGPRCRTSTHITNHWAFGFVGVRVSVSSAVIKVHGACALLGTAPPVPSWLQVFWSDVWTGTSYDGGFLDGAGVLPPDCLLAPWGFCGLGLPIDLVTSHAVACWDKNHSTTSAKTAANWSGAPKRRIGGSGSPAPVPLVAVTQAPVFQWLLDFLAQQSRASGHSFALVASNCMLCVLCRRRTGRKPRPGRAHGPQMCELAARVLRPLAESLFQKINSLLKFV